MSNINNEISSLLKEVFYELPQHKNEFLPIVKSSNNIKQIILFMIKYNTSNKNEINQNVNFLFILKEFFKINTNLIPLFMKDSFYSHNMSFYECLINLYLNERINDDNKLILEDLINFLIAHYSISKHNLEFIYQKLSKYFTNEAKEKLTESLLYRYLNLLNHFYTDNSILDYDKEKKEVKNYIYFNGINSDLSVVINKNSCNPNTDFPTLEKGCSFVFWINIKRKVTEEYFKILPEKTYINLVKINIGGQIILLQLMNPDNMRISTKNNITNDIKIDNLFKYNEWNNIVFIIEPSKGKKLATKLYINNNLINGTLILSENLNSKEKINNINLFENFLGKISSIIYFSFVIEQNLINHFITIKGFNKNKILLHLLNSFDKEYSYINSKDKKNYYNDKLNKKIKIKLSEQNINNLICCFIPLTYEKNQNILDDVFGNFIGKLNYNDGVNNYINKNKNIRDLGGINNLLPIIELMISSLKDDNPYKLIDKHILSERTFQEYLLIIQKILLAHENNFLNEKETHFFSCLSLFMEKIPSKFYNLSILQSIIGLINLPLENISKEDSLDNFVNIDINENKSFISNNFINLILLNEQIITKFTPGGQMELWDGVYNIFKRDLNKVSKTLNTPKICLLLRFYDEKRYEKYCCYKHACLFNNGNIDENKNNIMNPEMNYKVGKLFQIIQLYIDEVNDENNQVEDIFKLLSLDLSPCLQKKIINLYITHFQNHDIPEERKEKTFNNLLKNKYIELSEYVLKISLLDIRIAIFKLFKIFMTKYKNKFQEYFKNSSIDISQIICFYGFNILPDKLIIEIDSVESENKNKYIPIKKIRRENTINEELLNKNKKYIHLFDLFNKEEYQKEIELFWTLLNSSFKYEQNIIEKKNPKNRRYIINPFIFNFSLDFVSKVSVSYLEQFLVLIISTLKDESIVNRNIFFSDNIFFPWLIDTVFYCYNNENIELIKDKDLVKSIQKISINILCELFSHHRENDEVFKRLKYILDYSYYCKKINKNNNRLKEIARITRLILIQIFECFNEYIDIKSKIIFEFITLYKNSENIFKDEEFHVKEISSFPDKDFIEIDKNEKNNSNTWEIIDNIDINDDLINKNSDNENEAEEEEDNIPIDNNQKNKEARRTTINPKANKNEILIEEIILIPEYIYEGINIIDKKSIKENNNNNLENIWIDYKLFLDINDYYQKNLWGIDCLCKLAKIDNNINNFNNIVKDLYKFFGELKENENILIKDLLKYIDIKDKKNIKLNIFYINLLLLSIAIDVCQNNEEKEKLYIQYKYFLLFFILSSVNISNKIKTKIETNTYSYYLNRMFYNIIGFGFMFLQNRDGEKYKEIKDCLLTPIFSEEGKNIFGVPKKDFLRKSIIGKLFCINSKDDNLLNNDLKPVNRSSRAVTTIPKNNFLFNKNKSINSNNISENLMDQITFRGDYKLIITNIIDNTINFYKNSKAIWPNKNILKFYDQKNDENEEKNDDYKFIGMGSDELNKKIIEEEKRIYKTLKETIPFLGDEIKKYWNNIVLDQLKRRREYKKTKKRLFAWNGFWSDRKLFFGHPEYLKLQVKNHFTKDMTKVILSPILDINYYLPNFSKFNKNKLFNKDDYKYSISLNVEEILKITEDKIDDNINSEANINKKENNKNINNKDEHNKIEKIQKGEIIESKREEEKKEEKNGKKEEKKEEKNDKKEEKKEEKKEKIEEKNKINNQNKKEIIIEKNKSEIKENINKISEEKNSNGNNEKSNKSKPMNKLSDKIKFLNQKLSFNLNNPNSNPLYKRKSVANEKNEINKINNNNVGGDNKNDINNKNKNDINNKNKNDINKNDINKNDINKNLNNKNNKEQNKEKEKENIHNKNFKNCLAKDFNYLESLYKFTFKGIWEQYNKFYKGKMTLGNIALGNKDTFNILIQSKLMSSSQENKENENLYICCIVKPTHHIKGYMSTEKTSIKFTHCDEDEESQRLLEDDPSYDKELKSCFGSTFKSHIKDREKVCIEIQYKDMKYILFRNYFYQETACEIYTFSNKSYFLNFKDNKELTKFIDNILNHEQFRTIKGEDFRGKKILGYEKTFDSKAKSFKVKKIMEEWQNNNISTLQYLMWLNIFAGRSFNDLTQYPVLPWLITNYDKDELTNNDFRDLSKPIGMMDVSPKAETRKEAFIEFYETLKTDFKEANPEFNYSEYLKKADEYLEDLKAKKNKKKKDNNNNVEEEVGLKDINISSIELNQIPYFYGTHYSCPTFVSHYLMRLFPFCLLSVEIQGDKFDDPDRIFISLIRTFETASTLKEDIRELIPEFYSLPDMFLNKNNLNLTQDKLDAEGNAIVVHDVELPPWCNNISYIFVSEMRKNLEKNELKINKWVDLIFGSLQRGEKAEENHNIFMAQSYEGMVKIDSITDYDTRNALMRLCEVGVTPKQLFKTDTKQRNEKIEMKGKYLYESKELYSLSVIIIKYDEIVKKIYVNKSINKEYEEQIYPKIVKIKWIGYNELLLLNNLNYLSKLKYKRTSEGKHVIEEKIIINAINISSKYAPSYLMSQKNPLIIFYNNNKYMIKGGFWDGRIEINTLIIDPKEKHDSHYIFIKEGPIVAMEMTSDEKILLCGTKTGYLICFSVNGLILSIKKRIYMHNDEITSININNNLNMFATSSVDGYINMHILPSFDLVRSIKISVVNKNFFYGNYDDEFYYANNIFLSSSPLPCVAVFISSKRLFRTYTINGEFVEDREETKNSNYIKCSIIFNDLNFQEYLIYGTDNGRVKIRTFPSMDLINDFFPNDCNEIISMDISPDKKSCYIWNKDNKIIVIRDFYVEYDDDNKKKMENTEKGKEKLISNK